MKPAPFELHSPVHIDEALQMLAEHGEEAKVLAGGQSLVPMLALRLARFEHLVDVNGIDALSGVERTDGWLRIGSTTRHRILEQHPAIASLVPLLADATRLVGHFQIRNRGTLGGALAHGDPAAEQPAVALALGAVLEVESLAGRRDIPAADFFEGTWTTALAVDELLTAVRFPVWEGRSGFAVEEVARRHGDFALVGAACGVTLGERGLDRASIALFGVGPTAIRASGAAEALLAGATMDDVADAAVEGMHPPDDLHATGAYRRTVTRVLVKRVARKAMNDATRA